VTRQQDVWVCGQDLQLVRADRIVSLLVPLATGYGAASPDDPVSGGAVFAEVDSSASGSIPARVKLADCGKSPAGELLADLANALGSVSSSDGPAEGACVFVFADQDATGRTHWIVAKRLPQAWPQSTPPERTASSVPELRRPTGT
jgi:hypothetical protein